MEWWDENLTDGVKRRVNGDSKNIQPENEGVLGEAGSREVFVVCFFVF